MLASKALEIEVLRIVSFTEGVVESERQVRAKTKEHYNHVR
jgi:hypothetical protein